MYALRCLKRISVHNFKTDCLKFKHSFSFGENLFLKWKMINIKCRLLIYFCKNKTISYEHDTHFQQFSLILSCINTYSWKTYSMENMHFSNWLNLWELYKYCLIGVQKNILMYAWISTCPHTIENWQIWIRLSIRNLIRHFGSPASIAPSLILPKCMTYTLCSAAFITSF